MKRRVVEQGGLTLMISLPRKWAKKHGLSKGDELELTERGKELILATSKGIEEESSAVVEVTDSSKFFGRMIHTPYRFGYNQLEIRYKDSSVVPQIQAELDELLGYEIVEQGANHMKIEMVAREVEDDFDKMLRRILHLTADMAKDLVSAASAGDDAKLKEIAAREKTNNKLSSFCERMLNKHGYTDLRKTNFMYCTVWAMEQVADNVREIASNIGNKPSKNMLALLGEFSKYIINFNKLFYKHRSDDISAFSSTHNAFKEKLEGLKIKKSAEFKTLSMMNSATEKLRHLTLSLV